MKNLSVKWLSLEKLFLPVCMAVFWCASTSAHAQIFWAGGAGTWETAADWSTGTAPTITDDVVFNVSTNDSIVSAVTATAAMAANSITVSNTLATSITSSSSVARILTLGTGGITLASGAGAFTIGSTSATISVNLNGSQTWTNNSGSGLAISNAFFTASGVSSTLTLNNTSTGGIAFSNSLNDNGTGVLTLVVDNTGTGAVSIASNNTSTYSGGTYLEAGTLTARAYNIGTGTIYVGDSAANSSNVVLNLTSGGAINAIVEQSGTTGTLTIQNNSGTAQTTTEANTVTLNNTNSNLILANNGSNNNLFSFTNTISGAGGLTISGGIVALSGDNTYANGTNLTGGALDINSDTALGTGTFTISGGSINDNSGSDVTLTNNNAQIWNSNVTFVGTNNLNLGKGAVSLGTTTGTARTVTTTASNLTVGGVISNGTTATGLTKAGAGELTLSGTNAYTGATLVNAGTLNVTGSIAASSGTTLNGATAVLTGTGAFSALTLGANGGQIAPGLAGTSTGTMSAASLAWNGIATNSLTFTLSSTDDTSNLLNLTGALTKSSGSIFNIYLSGGVLGDTYTLIDFGSTNFLASDFTDASDPSGGTFSIVGNSLEFTVAAVPEPSTWALMAAGLVLVSGFEIRRRSKLAVNS